MDYEIEYGDEYPGVIKEHLDNCVAVLVIMSESSKASTWLANEPA